MSNTNAVNAVNKLLETAVAQQIGVTERFVKAAIAIQVDAAQSLGQDVFTSNSDSGASLVTYGANGLKNG
jgi:hypothetical protein